MSLMFPQVPGSIFISGQHFSQKRKASAMASIVAALEKKVPNITFISFDPIIYMRPYLQRGTVDISSFGSGRIDIENEQNGLHIRFSLGILPLLEQVAMMFPAYLLLLGGGVPERIAFPSMLVVGALIIARVAYTWIKVREWLVSLVSSAINSEHHDN